MEQATSVLIESFSKGLKEIRDRISEVRYSPDSGYICSNDIVFLFDGVRYSASLTGSSDLVLTDNLEENKTVAVRTLLNGYAKEVKI